MPLDPSVPRGISFGFQALARVKPGVTPRVMSAFLFGVGPMDPATYAAVAAILALVALLATYLPARRASRVDPLIALRADVSLPRPTPFSLHPTGRLRILL